LLAKAERGQNGQTQTKGVNVIPSEARDLLFLDGRKSRSLLAALLGMTFCSLPNASTYVMRS